MADGELVLEREVLLGCEVTEVLRSRTSEMLMKLSSCLIPYLG